MAGNAILIVDDNLINLKLVKVLLEYSGYRVRTAVDADGVVQTLKEFRPDLILMDIQLPGMDGLTLTRQLKADPNTAAIPVVALTAYAMKGDDEKALASGCSGYITKPVDTRNFTKQLEQFLEAGD